MIGITRATDRTGIRDFPLIIAPLESRTGVSFNDRAGLLSDYSAALYFATTLPEPFRSEELRDSHKKAGDLLRISIGASWPHLRFCTQCAQREFSKHRYSWWHRDHQLPLASVCALHDCPLISLQLNQLALNLPHEMMGVPNREVKREKPSSLEFAISRFERFLATGHRRSVLESLFQQVKCHLYERSADPIDQFEIACAIVKRLVMQLRECGVHDPMRDWHRLSVALNKLLDKGINYADPIAAVLLVVSFNHFHLLKSGSSE